MLPPRPRPLCRVVTGSPVAPLPPVDLHRFMRGVGAMGEGRGGGRLPNFLSQPLFFV